MRSSKLIVIILSLILIVLAILPFIKGDQRWYLQPDLSEEESKNISSPAFEVIKRSDDVSTNASLYLSTDAFDQLNNRSESQDSLPVEYTGRSAKMMNFDDLLAQKSERNYFEGNREPRIINDEKESNLAIKGFIPIVGFGNDKQESEDKPKKAQQNSDIQHYISHSYPQHSHNGYSHSLNPQKHVSRPEDQRFIGAALQGLAASLSGKPTRKQGFGNELNNNFGFSGLAPNEGCVCVPFYMCKNGFLTETAKNSASNSATLESAQSIINQYSMPMQSSHHQQKPHNSNQFDYLPLDERSTDDLKIGSGYDPHSYTNNTAPQYADDVLARMLGVRSDGCGVLRTCCRSPTQGQDYQLEISPEFLPEYQIHGNHPNSPIQMQEYNAFNKRLTNPYQPNIQQIPEYIKPQRPHKYDIPYQRPVEAFPSQIVQASYGFPTKHSNPAHNYGGIATRPVPQLPLPIKPEYPLIKPIHQRPVPVYPGYKPQPSPHHIDSIESHHNLYGTCGIRQAVGIHGRVQNLNYHESSTEFGEYPWQVAILKRLGPADSLYVCGGAIISPLFIITAAHCIKKYNANDLKVRLGEWDVHREDEFYPYVEKYIKEIIIHPEFFPGNLLNDMALIRMDSPVDFNQYPHIAPICLPEPHETFAGHRCYVSGWGKNSFGHQGEFQSVLTKVDVPVLSHVECERALQRTRLGYNYQLHPSMVCAGGEPGKDACEGDGGSGMVCDVRGIWKVAGLVSWGVGCGQPGVPGVYTNMAYMKAWIDGIVLRYSTGSIGSIGSIGSSHSIYDIISERSFSKAINSTENENKQNREESQDLTTTSSSI